MHLKKEWTTIENVSLKYCSLQIYIECDVILNKNISTNQQQIFNDSSMNIFVKETYFIFLFQKEHLKGKKVDLDCRL